MMKMNKEHGSPWDRGSTDSYYRRGRSPHWYPDGIYKGACIEKSQMTQQEIAEYEAGYDENERTCPFKDWG